MFKIFFKYSDKSKCTITGKTGSITLDQAKKYHNTYGIHACSSIYQEYPKTKNEPIELYEKIQQLQEAEEVA